MNTSVAAPYYQKKKKKPKQTPPTKVSFLSLYNYIYPWLSQYITFNNCTFFRQNTFNTY